MNPQEKKAKDFFERNYDLYNSYEGDFDAFFFAMRKQWRLHYQEDYSFDEYIDHLTNDEEDADNTSQEIIVTSGENNLPKVECLSPREINKRTLSQNDRNQQPSEILTETSYPIIETVTDDMNEYEDDRPCLSDGKIKSCDIPGKENLKTDLEAHCTPYQCNHFFECQWSYINWYVKIPFFIIDNTMKNVSLSAFKIFIYICRRTNFNTKSNHFSRCWLTMSEISEATGVKVSNMRKYVLELINKGMINCTVFRRNYDTGFKTIHEFTVHHIKILNDRRQESSNLRKQANKS